MGKGIKINANGKKIPKDSRIPMVNTERKKIVILLLPTTNFLFVQPKREKSKETKAQMNERVKAVQQKKSTDLKEFER